jgi:hypothetical protein
METKIFFSTIKTINQEQNIENLQKELKNFYIEFDKTQDFRIKNLIKIIEMRILELKRRDTFLKIKKNNTLIYNKKKVVKNDNI